MIEFNEAIFLGPAFFRTTLPSFGELERAGMPLHDAVGVNCKAKKGATIVNQRAGAMYMG